MSFDDERTRRIPATPPPRAPYPPPVAGAVPAHDPLLADELRRRLASLRTAVALLGLLGALALGLALYALLADDDDDATARGASQERVSAIEQRVDELEERLDDRATKGQVEELQAEQEQLAEQVEEAATDEGGDDAAQAVEALQQDLQELQGRVDGLEQAPADENGGTTTP